MNPLVSIMIATYNQPDYIVQAVLSCLNQDYDNIEVVVGDDSTNDCVYNALLPFFNNEKLKYFRNEKNLGRVKNYKKLLFDYALGDWAIMLDGDDFYIDNHFISKAMKWITENDNIVLVAAGHLVTDENICSENTEVLTTIDKCFDGKEIFYQKIKLGQHSTNLYKRKLAIDLDFYRLESMGTDSEGIFRLCLHGKIVYLSNTVVNWRIHNQNNTFKSDDAIKQMHEMIFIDYVYQYALKFIDQAAATSWRNSFYTSMSYHITGLAENSGSYLNILRVSYWASEFWGIQTTFRYLKSQTYKYFFKK
jgi:glycosyltransferase involved in cell wall biosynthesis